MQNFFNPSQFLKKILKPLTYGESLEYYIESNYPKDITDIERLTNEWHRIHSGGWLK